MSEHEKELSDWLAREWREARDRRLMDAVRRMLSRSVTHATCPVCNGSGELAVILGAVDDQ